jgi:hypothetical protein
MFKLKVNKLMVFHINTIQEMENNERFIEFLSNLSNTKLTYKTLIF